MEKTKKDKNSRLNRWLATYRFVILNEQSYEETFSYKLNRLNVFLFFSVSILLLIISTFLVISYTPLKEYIPGYDSSELRRKAIMNNYKLDSIQEKLMRNQRYIIAVSEVLRGDLDIYELEQRVNSDTIYSNKSLLEFKTSEADSLLRIEVENDEKYNITQTGEDKSLLTLFKPISGKVTQKYDPMTRHYAVDIATKLNTPVRATTDYFAKAVATATGNSSIVLGASAGNIVTVNVPQTDITGVTRGDTGGVNSLSLPYLALPTTAGNNELSIVMT